MLNEIACSRMWMLMRAQEHTCMAAHLELICELVRPATCCLDGDPLCGVLGAVDREVVQTL